MKWTKQIKSCIEVFLFFLCGNLMRLCFSGQLRFFDNFVLFISAMLVLIYIWTVRKISERMKEKEKTLSTMVEYHAIKETGWIFNSERTPDKSDYYIAWIFDPSVDRFEVRKIWFKVNEQDVKKSEWQGLHPEEHVIKWISIPTVTLPPEPCVASIKELQ